MYRILIIEKCQKRYLSARSNKANRVRINVNFNSCEAYVVKFKAKLKEFEYYTFYDSKTEYEEDKQANLIMLRKQLVSRACLKKASHELRVPVCGRFYPNEGGVAGYGNRMRVKYTAKWGLQIAEMIFQTRSRALESMMGNSTSEIYAYMKPNTVIIPENIIKYVSAKEWRKKCT